MQTDDSRRDSVGHAETRVLYVDDPPQIETVATFVAESRDGMVLEGEATRAGARERVRRESFDCVVAELKYATAVADATGETPLVLFTETDPTAISDDLLEAADTLVQKGEETQLDFLLDKIRGVAGADDPVGEADDERITDEVPDARVEFFVLGADGRVEWSSTPVADFFPRAVSQSAEGGTLHDRLSRAATGEYAYTDRMVAAVATGEAAERVGLELPREAPPGESATATYSCWSYPLDDGQRRLEAYRDETATIQQSDRLARLERLVELARDGLYMLDADARYAFVTEAYAEMLGYEREELLGRHASSVMSGGALKRGQKAVESLLNDPDRDSAVLDQVHQRKDGRERQLSIHFTLMTDEDGSYRGLMGVARDVTERREREQELAEYQTVFESVFDRVYVLDGDGSIRLANEPFASLLGTTPGAVEGADAAEVLGGAAYDEIQSVVDRLQTSPKDHGVAEITLEDDTGTEVPCETYVSLLSDDGHEEGCVGVVRDISERVQREQQVAVLDRVLRHNLRNDLSVVLGRAELLADELDDGDAAEMVETIQRRCERLMEFAEKARRAQRVLEHAFTKRSDTVDVSEVVDRVATRIRKSHESASVSTAVEPTAAAVPQTLTIALTDLVKNAVEHNDHAEPWVEVSVTGADDRIEIAVADDGPGIPDNEREVLTDGTETPLRHGSGIGFWLVHWIVSQAGGRLAVEERDPRGSVVRMTLPRSGR